MEHDFLMLITNVTRGLLGLLILGSLWSLMHAFTGGKAGDFQALDSLQFSGLLFSTVVAMTCLFILSRERGLSAGIGIAWNHVPGWLLMAGTVLVSLAVVGELTYYLLRDAVWISNDWVNHSALFCLSLSTLAFVLVSGTGRYLSGGAPYSKARW